MKSYIANARMSNQPARNIGRFFQKITESSVKGPMRKGKTKRDKQRRAIVPKV